MQIRFLSLDRDEIFLLGYRLKLSPTEEKLLRAIAEGGKSDLANLVSLLPTDVGSGNVAVHINSINRKAKRISDRRLIICRSGQYKINEFM